MRRSVFSLSSIVIAVSIGLTSTESFGQQNPRGLVIPSTAQVHDVFTPLLPQEVSIRGGFLGTRIDANATNRMLKVDEDDMLDAFEQREAPHQDWQGEHVGKFLHAATLTWNYTHDPQLKTKLDSVVARLLKTQEPDGYLGTYKQDHRWTSWDVWVHKYDLLGLLTYYQFTRLANQDRPTSLGSEALNASRRIGNLLIATFGIEPGKRDINKSGEHMGMAPDSVLEPIVLLYRATEDKRYLDFARYIVSNYDAKGGPAILASLESKGSVRAVANAKAYEMTSNFNGLLELYRATGEKRLLRLMQVAWTDIVKNRLYVTGSASAGELFQEDYHLPNLSNANICETCVTVTWEQMNLQLLRLTGQPRYVDELEKSIYNHLLAAQKPTGDDWAYYTPLEGRKPYDSAATCCHSSGPRGIALIPGIAYMTSADGGLVVNLYNSGRATTHLKSGSVTIEQRTEYPLGGGVMLTISPEKRGQRFPLRLRIPSCTSDFGISLNGRNLPANGAGYVVIDRAWSKNDTLTLSLKLTDRVVVGDHENTGKAALMYGPLVLAVDSSVNPQIGPLNRVGLGLDLKALTKTDHGDLLANTSATSLATAGFLIPPKGNEAKRNREEVGEVRTGRGGKDHPRISPQTFTGQGEVSGKGKILLTLLPYAEAGSDGKSRFEVWIPLRAPPIGATSLFSGNRWTASRRGNVMGDITDDDSSTLAVTFNNAKADEDWFAVTASRPTTINTVVFAHGQSFHDGGWFDTEGGKKKPLVQVQTEAGGPWKTAATLEGYPNTTTAYSAGLKSGREFAAKFASIKVYAIRVIGTPASGDNPAQNFSSCSELQALYDRTR